MLLLVLLFDRYFVLNYYSAILVQKQDSQVCFKPRSDDEAYVDLKLLVGLHCFGVSHSHSFKQGLKHNDYINLDVNFLTLTRHEKSQNMTH